ncbi:hypothetical protein [Sphingomonas rubra]|uniref:Lipoprotein n=1 Tax=Sphingomonas rubra TaxID=634430 RepID=A0A1I5SES2_9SPHN|nr:hypothetical protein [Sphingomonas rubra]SFP69248.1 hypothetical protein SAMN04488241_105182 [Sphingomonas rubra]
MRIVLLPLLALPLLAGGCLSTAAAVVKAPFQAAGQVVDWSTTSQEESDRNYGRKMRKAEARDGKERREFEKHCRREPDSDTCRRGYQGYVAGRD